MHDAWPDAGSNHVSTNTSADSLVDGVQTFTYPLAASDGKVVKGGWGKQATAAELPISQDIAGVLMHLDPGAVREFHWHANAAEWGFVTEGMVRVTLFDGEERITRADIMTGDAFYFPRGYAHVIQNASAEPATFLLIFDDGHFSEFATFSLTDWVAHTPKTILSETLKVSEDALAGLPDGEVYIVPGPVPPPLEQDGPQTLQAENPLSCGYRFSQQPAERYAGGTIKIASRNEFPLSTTITGAYMTIDPGAVREPHWHPNAAEWFSVLQGTVRVTLFASQGHARTEVVSTGDVCYIPRGQGHYLENHGEDEVHLVLGFNSGVYEQIGLSGWLGANARQTVATVLGLPVATVEQFPGGTEYLPAKRRG
jgi:oxalate decarboxylase